MQCALRELSSFSGGEKFASATSASPGVGAYIRITRLRDGPLGSDDIRHVRRESLGNSVQLISGCVENQHIHHATATPRTT